MEVLLVLFPQTPVLANIFIIDFELDDLQQFVNHDGKHPCCKRTVPYCSERTLWSGKVDVAGPQWCKMLSSAGRRPLQ